MYACMARQPIFDADRDVFGYELLFRSGPENVFCGMDDNLATTALISDSIHVHDLSATTDRRRCFINITKDILVQETYSFLPPELTVLELLETVEPDRELIQACKKAKEKGYTVALDDYMLEQKFECLLPVIDILKVEFLGLDHEQRAAAAEKSRKFGFQLLAEKVETHDDFKQACKLGYVFFQGFFFCRPEMIQQRALPENEQSCMRLIEQLNQPEMNLDQLEEIIRQDLTLSYKLLKYLNSAAFGFRSKIESIKHGMVLLGDRQLRKWASVVALGSIAGRKPSELLVNSLVRARFCELIADELGLAARKGDLFMLGMFSILEALLDRPMKDLIAGMPLPEDMTAALVGDPSPLSDVLEIVLAFEQADWLRFGELATSRRAEEGAVCKAYAESIVWATELTRQLAQPVPKAAAA